MTKIVGPDLGSYLLRLPLHRPHRDKLGQVLTAFRRADHPPDPKDRDAFRGTTTRSPSAIVFTKFQTCPVLFAIVAGEASG